MTSTSTDERRQALAWIGRQLWWERRLADLRDGADEPVEEREAA